MSERRNPERSGCAWARRLLAVSVLVTFPMMPVQLLTERPARALELPRKSPDWRVARNLERAILAFEKQYGRWPRNTPELRRYLRRTGRTSSVRQFSKVSLAHKRGNTLLVTYVLRGRPKRSGMFAISLVRVKP